MRAILNFNGFTKEIDVEHPMPRVKIPWLEPLSSFEERRLTETPEFKVLEFHLKNVSPDHLEYEWDRQNLFWGKRWPHGRP